MDRTQLFQFLSTQDSSVLLDLLSAAYDEMNRDQRQAVFGRHARALPPAPVEGETLLSEAQKAHLEAEVQRQEIRTERES